MSPCDVPVIVAVAADTPVVDDLTVSKGKGEDEQNAPILNQAAVEVPRQDVVLPPPPSALCDCHGFILADCPGVPSFSSHFCNICLEQFVPGPLRQHHSVNCHTFACDQCVTDSLSFAVSNGQVNAMQCPSCGWHLLAVEVARRLAPPDVAKYHYFLLRKKLAMYPNLHECGNPGCDNAVLVEDKCALETWSCEACSVTCSFCRGPAHADGGRCQAERRFRKAERRHKVWVALSISKKCPGCKTPIIKKGGCPHMSCKNPQCGHQWCWHCKRDWATHGTCIFDKLAIAGLIVASPVIVPVVASGLIVAAVGVSGAALVTGGALFDIRKTAKRAFSLAEDVWDKFF